MISQLRKKIDTVQANAHAALKQNKQSSDMVFSMTFFKTFLNRLLHFHLHAGVESLAILGCPQLLAPIESLCGEQFITTVDMLVIKHKENDAKIPWHQDLIYPSNQYRVATAGIYLDDSYQAQDALKLIASTSSSKQDICAIERNPPTSIIEVPAKAGDILIHNPMMVHSSNNITGQSTRRTLYYEFRPLEQLKNQNAWQQPLLDQRLNLMKTAQAIYAKNKNGTTCQVIEDIASLYLETVPFNSANFCHHR
jgi:ectoine hydroxylase-related dioxygenase (phytanoyl-CoA dioxygenase family)